jgi:hypothetical protein
MASNFSANEASKKLNGNFINISISGSTFPERKMILNHLLKTKTIKYMILSADENVKIDFINKYDKLYKNFFNKLHWYINENLMTLLSSSILRKDLIHDLDRPEAWHKLPEHRYRFGGFGNWIKAALNKNAQAISSLKSIKASYENKLAEKTLSSDEVCEEQASIDENLLYFVQKYKNTHFILFIPPYHKIYWKTEKCISNEYQKYVVMVKYLVDASKKYSNMTIYGFDNENFTFDIAVYKDRVHYGEKINSFILDSIRDRTHILTLENIDVYIEQIEKDIKNFDIKPFYDQIKNLQLD